MPAPKKPNTGPANDARRDPLGRTSKPVRVLAAPEVHEWLRTLTPEQIGDILVAARNP